MNILMITSEWPTAHNPHSVPFITRQVKFLRDKGIEVDVFHFRGYGRPDKYIKAWLRFHFEFRKQKYDLIHAQWGQSGLIAFPRRMPLVVTLRGSDVQGIPNSRGNCTLKGKMLQLATRFVVQRADEVVVVSQHIADRLPNRIYHVIPSGIDRSVFFPRSRSEARKELNMDPDLKVVLFGGRPNVPVKRFELAEATMYFVKREFPTAHLQILDRIPHQQIPQYMNACDLLLLTSYYEGSPNVVKEALACNLPIVSTNVGDVQERINGIDGCFVCNDNPEDLAIAVLSVLRASQRVSGQGAIEDLEESLLTSRLIEVYKRALSR